MKFNKVELPEPQKAPTKKTPPRMIEVLRIEQPHPEIKRVIFSGSDLKGFPSNMNGSHIKLFFPQAHQQEPVLPTLGPKGPIWPSKFERPITRTYTLRFYDPLINEIAVDFAWHSISNHKHQGPACRWLAQVKKGQRIGLAGPGGPDPLIHPAQIQIFIGDTSALGALWALTEMPSSSVRFVYLVANHDADFELPRQHIQCYRPKDYPTLNTLTQDLRFDLENRLNTFGITQDSDLAAFIAGENAMVLSIRNYFKNEFQLTKKRMYAIPYWSLGQDEEAYHQTRHNIMDEVY